jgi:hypothetical protein
MQGWYLEALQASAWLAAMAGQRDTAQAYKARADVLRRTLREAYWDSDQRAFRKYRAGDPERPADCRADLVGQHENVLFPLLGIGTARQRRQALDATAGPAGMYLPDLGGHQGSFMRIEGGLVRLNVLEEGDPNQHGTYTAQPLHLIGSPFWSFYALQALMEDGRVDAALNYMRIAWGLMLANGATTCWEMWDRRTSQCHGWSAGPAMILPAYVLGVRPLKPGFREFTFAPQAGNLACAEGTIPTPHGPIRVELEQVNTQTRGRISVPEGTTARVAINGTKQRLAAGDHDFR